MSPEPKGTLTALLAFPRMPSLQAFVEANVSGSTGSPEGYEVRLIDLVRRAGLRCALLPVPRASRGRVAHELEEEYPGVVRRRGGVRGGLWYLRELASIFGWYAMVRMAPRRRRRDAHFPPKETTTT